MIFKMSQILSILCAVSFFVPAQNSFCQEADEPVLQRRTVDPEAVEAVKVFLEQRIETIRDKRFLGLADRAQIRRLERVLKNHATLERVALKFQDQMTAATGDDGDGEGRWFGFLKWLIDNQDEVFRFITLLIQLFGFAELFPQYVSLWTTGNWL